MCIFSNLLRNILISLFGVKPTYQTLTEKITLCYAYSNVFGVNNFEKVHLYSLCVCVVFTWYEFLYLMPLISKTQA
jgi:hypothetical protein